MRVADTLTIRYNISIALIIGMALASCCKPYIAFETYLKNTTSHPIELRAYKTGITASLNISKGTISQAPVEFALTYDYADSILVFYNNQLKAVHYSKLQSQAKSTVGKIAFTDRRSLFSKDSFLYEKKELDCNGSITKYSYEFVD